MSECVCVTCQKTFDGVADAIEHIRKCSSGMDIRRPGALYDEDSHGNMWYCFSCSKGHKDHRSFQTNEAMRQHLSDVHRHAFNMVELLPDSFFDYDYNVYVGTKPF